MTTTSLSARLLEPTAENLRRMAQVIRDGGLIGMPTETVYGLAGDAFRPETLAAIFLTKDRPVFDPLIIHVPETILAGGLLGLNGLNLVDTPVLSELAWTRAEKLIKAFWPGPLTLVLPKLNTVPDLATSGLPTVAVRMPRHPVAQELLRLCGTPLAAPSANRFGRISPTRAIHVLEEFRDGIAWVLNGGSCEVGLESSVVSIDESGSTTLLRPGGIPRAEIERVIEHSLVLPSGLARATPTSPGMLDSHYAPMKMLFLLPARLRDMNSELLPANALTRSAGILVMAGMAEDAKSRWRQLTGAKPAFVRVLSEAGDLGESARNLFAMLRELDQSEAEILYAEPCTVSQGLGHAISDRLRRASHRGQSQSPDKR